MSDTLRHLGGWTAAGVLARAALALDDPMNPAANAILEGEWDFRARILAQARENIGLATGDDSPEAIEKLGDFLDQQAEQLIGPPDINSALRRLAEAGSLPSDMYEIRVDPGIKDWMGRARYHLELALIEKTIRQPDIQQHFARASNVREPSLASLFFRRFKTRWPFKDFGMLVVGSRDSLILNIGQAWRIYPALLDVTGAKNLVEMLRIFTTKYGFKVSWEGRTGSFFLTVDEPLPSQFNYRLDGVRPGHNHMVIASVIQHRSGRATAALVAAVDLEKYDKDLNKMAVAPDQIIDDFKAIEPLRGS